MEGSAISELAVELSLSSVPMTESTISSKSHPYLGESHQEHPAFSSPWLI